MRAYHLIVSVALLLVAPGAVLVARALSPRTANAAPVAGARPELGAPLVAPTAHDGPLPEGRPTPPTQRPFLGVILPRESTNVAPALPGKVVSVDVRIGDRVRAGDALATLDARLVAADLAAARATVNSQYLNHQMARAAHDVAVEHEKRVKNLAAEGLSSGEELINRTKDRTLAELQVKASGSSVQQAWAQAERLKRERDLMVVRAPFDGTVVARYVDPGTSISATTLTPIVKLISSDRLFLRLAIPEERAREVHQGTPITAVSNPEGVKLRGRIERIAPEVDTSTHVAFAEASIDDATGEVLSGLVVDATIAQD